MIGFWDFKLSGAPPLLSRVFGEGGFWMRRWLLQAVFTLTLLAASAGCGGSSSPRPIAAGTAERGTVWKKPVQQSGENFGNPIPVGSRVEVYDQFILVTPPGEPTFLSLHGWYTDLAFKR